MPNPDHTKYEVRLLCHLHNCLPNRSLIIKKRKCIIKRVPGFQNALLCLDWQRQPLSSSSSSSSPPLRLMTKDAPHSCKALARPPSPAPLAAVRGGQLVRSQRLRCAHAEPEALHRAVTPAASPSRGDVRRPPLPLSEPQLGSHCSPPLLHQAPRCSPFSHFLCFLFILILEFEF